MSARPDSIFKYRTFDEAKHRRMLSHREIFFPPPSLLNDPLDCRNPFHILATDSDEKYREFLLICWENQRSTSPETDAEAHTAIDQKVRNRPTSPEAKLAAETFFQQHQSESWGVFSASCDDSETGLPGYSIPRMWSTYGAIGSGFCVEFDVHALIGSMQREGIVDPFIQRVNYGPLPFLSPYMADGDVHGIENSDIEQILTCKTEVWAAERECRWLRYRPSSRTLVLPPGIIKNVYLGENVTEDNIRLAGDLLRSQSDRPALFVLSSTLDRIEY
jgi:hypothetical protein